MSDAAQRFPVNVNVAFAVARAGIGPERTQCVHPNAVGSHGACATSVVDDELPYAYGRYELWG